MTPAWLIYQGLHAGLSLAEALTSHPGEIFDFYYCRAIDNGAQQKKKLTFDQAMGVM